MSKHSEAYADIGPPARRFRPGAFARMREDRPAVVELPPEPAGCRAWLAENFPACLYGTGAIHGYTEWAHVPHRIRAFVLNNYRPVTSEDSHE